MNGVLMTALQLGLLATASLLLLSAPASLQQSTPSVAASPESPALPTYAFTNGKWFNGSSFEDKTVYSVEGRLRMSKPARVDRVLDLKGAYIVPPFAEAHNHNFGAGSAQRMEETRRRYLADGVFYAKMQSNLPRLTDPIRSHFNKPTSVDVVFANGPLTATGGHPVKLRERLLAQGVYPGFTKETLKDHGYVIIDSERDLEAKWERILSFRPDFIKTILVFSEEFEKRKNNDAHFGERGLDPSLLPKIVRKAHEHGLRVSVHVETGTDFHHAVWAGADEIAHMTGTRWPTRIDPKDAAEAARRGIVVVTTASLINRLKDQAERYRALREAQIASLKLLQQQGVKLAAGSDIFDDTSVLEAMHLRELGVFDNLTLLKMWTETAAQTIFPERRIGALREGYEASFLALEGDPIRDFENVRRIRLRFKQGVLLGM